MAIRPIVTLLLIVSLIACGASAQAVRQKAVDTTVAATNAARDGLVAFDDEKQTQLVADLTDAAKLADAKVKIAAYRAQRATVTALFIAVYLAAAEAGVAKADEASLNKLAAAAKDLKVALDALLKGAP